jgi:hypothetical protein
MKISSAFLGVVASLAILVQLPAAARADQAGKDPEVAALRERFSHAEAPNQDQLDFGHDWGCKYRSVEPGSHMTATFPNSYRFELGPDATIHADSLSGPYELTDTALVGTKTWGPRTYGEEHLRYEPASGALLVEFTLPECSGLECLFWLVRDASLDNHWEAVIGYAECREE